MLVVTESLLVVRAPATRSASPSVLVPVPSKNSSLVLLEALLVLSRVVVTVQDKLAVARNTAKCTVVDLQGVYLCL